MTIELDDDELAIMRLALMHYSRHNWTQSAEALTAGRRHDFNQRGDEAHRLRLKLRQY